MPQKLYRPAKFRLYTQNLFRGVVFVCFGIGAVATCVSVYSLGKYYVFEKPVHNRQRREYAEAIIKKERREKELGLRD